MFSSHHSSRMAENKGQLTLLPRSMVFMVALACEAFGGCSLGLTSTYFSQFTKHLAASQECS